MPNVTVRRANDLKIRVNLTSNGILLNVGGKEGMACLRKFFLIYWCFIFTELSIIQDQTEVEMVERRQCCTSLQNL